MAIEFEELLAFVDKEDARLQAHYATVTDQSVRVLARTVKLSEELGELCEQVLTHTSLQRAEKLRAATPNALADEFADVMLTTLLLAKSLHVDVRLALEQKMEKITKRAYT